MLDRRCQQENERTEKDRSDNGHWNSCFVVFHHNDDDDDDPVTVIHVVNMELI